MTERFKLFFSVDTVELHDLCEAEHPTAKTRCIRQPRDSGLGENDPNVVMLRAMAEAGNAAVLTAHQLRGDQ